MIAIVIMFGMGGVAVWGLRDLGVQGFRFRSLGSRVLQGSFSKAMSAITWGHLSVVYDLSRHSQTQKLHTRHYARGAPPS